MSPASSSHIERPLGNGGPLLVTMPDAKAAALEVAQRIARASKRAVEQRGRYVVSFSGGSAPRPVYTMLAEAPREAVIPWDRFHVWFNDERCVPPSDPRSNYGMVRELLLSRVPVNADHVHRFVGELGAQAAADRGEQELKAFAREVGGWPLFDTHLIGIGPDGHTASLFPGAPQLAEKDRRVVASTAPAGMEVAERVTMTLAALCESRIVLMLATGEEKREILARVIGGEELPASRARGRSGTVWVVDRAARG